MFFSPTDDGKIFHGSGVGDAFGPRCFKGDIMGCGIMFPRDYILDGEGKGATLTLTSLVNAVGTSVGGFDLKPAYCGLA